MKGFDLGALLIVAALLTKLKLKPVGPSPEEIKRLLGGFGGV